MQSSEVLTVIRGTDVSLRVSLTLDGSPFDLSDAAEIKAIFVNHENSIVSVSMTENDIQVLNNEAAGEILISLDNDFTETLRTGDRQTFEVEIEINDLIYVTQFKQGLDVVARLS